MLFRSVYEVDLFPDKDKHEICFLDYYEEIPDDVVEFINYELAKFPDINLIRIETTLQNLFKVESFSHLSPKIQTDILLKAGVSGIRYPANSLSGMAKEGVYNYVVFSDKDVKIKNKTKFFLNDPLKSIDNLLNSQSADSPSHKEQLHDIRDSLNYYQNKKKKKKSPYFFWMMCLTNWIC